MSRKQSALEELVFVRAKIAELRIEVTKRQEEFDKAKDNLDFAKRNLRHHENWLAELEGSSDVW